MTSSLLFWLLLLVSTIAVASGACTNTTSKQCSALSEGDYLVINGDPCQIANVSSSGAGQIYIVAFDDVTAAQVQDTCSSSDVVDVPNVAFKEYQLIGSTNGTVKILGPDGITTRENVPLPTGVEGLAVRDTFEKPQSVIVTMLVACGGEFVLRYEIL